MTTEHNYPRTIHILVSGTTVPWTTSTHRIALRGETVTITPEQYEDSKDRTGASTWDKPSDRWADGPAPETISFLGDDDVSVIAARRERLREEASRIENHAERVAALRKLNDTFGVISTSTTIRKTV